MTKKCFDSVHYVLYKNWKKKLFAVQDFCFDVERWEHFEVFDLSVSSFLMCAPFSKKNSYMVRAGAGGGSGSAGGAPVEGCDFRYSMYMLYRAVNVANCSGVSGGGPAGTEAGATVTVGVTCATCAAVVAVTDVTGLGGIMITHGSALGAACIYISFMFVSN